MDEMVKLVRDIGFPIALVIYLLWERRSVMKDLVGAVHELREAIVVLRNKE